MSIVEIFKSTVPMAVGSAGQVFIDLSALPDISRTAVDFRDTSFFQSKPSSGAELPSPSSILQKYGDRGRTVIKMEDLNLAVKMGQADYFRLEEAQAMIAVRAAFPGHELPVPEVFGWRKHGNKNFLYMSLVQGETLYEQWPTFSHEEKESVCGELAEIVKALRRIRPDSGRPFVGSISRGVVQDRFFKLDYEKGPFDDLKSFHDWFLAAATVQKPGPEGIVTGPDLYREYLPDHCCIFFTHGDLTLQNIIISRESGKPRIAAVVDWEQAGWYPEYWEYCKVLEAVPDDHEMRTAGWVEEFMDTYEGANVAHEAYYSWRNP